MASREPDHVVRWPVVRQEWRDVVFLHWAYPAETVARHLPRGRNGGPRPGSPPTGQSRTSPAGRRP